jgi:hypothetical protein
MTQAFTGVVYNPPCSGLPHVAVLFGPNGDAIQCTSVAEGEAFIATVLTRFAAAQGGGTIERH